MVITAGAGLLVNIVMAKVLHSAPPSIAHKGCDHHHDHTH